MAPQSVPLLRAARTWLLRHIPRDCGVARVVQYYRRQGGEPFREADSRFWKVWGSFRSGAGCAGALHAFNAGSFGSAAEAVTLAVSGLNFGPRFELDAATLIVEPS